MSNKGTGNQIPREFKLFFGRCFLEPAGRMRYDFHFSNESSSNFILIFKRNKGVHAKNLGPGQLG